MMKNYFIASMIILFLSNCASQVPLNQSHQAYKSANQHSQTIAKLTRWQIQGKIALLQKDKRESANIFWKNDQQSEKQTLNLTTYLGINVLKLHSEGEQHTLEVSGEKYQTDDINQLILQLTGYQLPTQALSFWLKGAPFSEDDLVKTHNTSFLPEQITSHYRGADWIIDYKKYSQFSGYQLPTHIVLKQNDFTLKIIIHQWTLL